MRFTIVTFFLSLFSPLQLQQIKLNILHTSAFQAHFLPDEQTSNYGIPRIIGFVKQEKEANPLTIYLETGDMFFGNLWHRIFRWKVVADFAKMMRIDAMAVGEHEFFHGYDSVLNFYKDIKVPIICSNCDLTNEPILRPYVKRSTVLTIGKIRVGIVSYFEADEHLKYIFGLLNEDFTIKDEAESVQNEVNKLTVDGVKIIILIAHGDFEESKSVARNVSNVDLIVGGHSKTLLYNGPPPIEEEVAGPYPTIVKDADGKDLGVVHAYEHGMFVGKIQVTFDADGNVASYEGNPAHMDTSIDMDRAASILLADYTTRLKETTSEVLGSSNVFLDASCLGRECNFGNLMADACVEYKVNQYTGEHWTDVPLALILSGAIGASINITTSNRAITYGNLLDVLPYEDHVAVVEVNGSVFKQILEQSVSDLEKHGGSFLQVSGVRVVYDVDREPQDRVVSCSVRCAKCEVPRLEPLKDDETYTFVTTGYLTYGGAGYHEIFPSRAISIQADPKSQLEIVRDYVKFYGMLRVEVGRITIIKKEEKERVKSRRRPNDATRQNKYILLNIYFSLLSLFVST